MAKVKIQGHASGTGVITLTAPNTSTDRTVTLPDADVTLGASPVTALNNATANELVTVGATTTELDAEANLTFDGTDLTLGTGDIVFGTAGKGICLGVTSNTDANTLDDYEEGSFTPVFTGSGGSAGSYDTGEHEARYTKIGRLVTIHWKLTLTNKGSWSGEVRFTGLPFTPAFTLNGAGSIELGNVNYTGDSVGNVNTYITASQTYWRPRYTKDNEAAVLVDVSEVDSDAFFGGTLSYIVA